MHHRYDGRNWNEERDTARRIEEPYHSEPEDR